MTLMTLGKTGIVCDRNGFGALPIQRVETAKAIEILRRALDGGITYFDTARLYSDSEEKLGLAFAGMRDKIFLATKTPATTPDAFWRDLETSLTKLKTDYIDVYQFHCAAKSFAPDDGTGMYECMLEAKKQGKIRHIGLTAHLLGVARDCVESGLYETLQYPLSYLSSDDEIAMVRRGTELGMGLVAMKGLAGGLITNAAAASAFLAQFPGVLPIWGIQRDKELDDFLGFVNHPVSMTPELALFIEQDKKELVGEFCRGCGYCMPCPEGITIWQSARMSLMLRRAPSAHWLTPEIQEMMKAVERCKHCGACAKKCPYGLNTPELLAKNYEDYKKVLSGEIKTQ